MRQGRAGRLFPDALFAQDAGAAAPGLDAVGDGRHASDRSRWTRSSGLTGGGSVEYRTQELRTRP